MFQLYDTRTRQVAPIRPARGRTLRMYTCGPAVQRPAHVGSLRSCLLADLIRRNAEHRHQLTVLACQNITDPGHLADGRAPGGSYESAFLADSSALNLRPAENLPRASDGVGPVIAMISRLIEAGHANPGADGSVYFDVRSFPGYGELSGHRSGEDWALWTAAVPGQELTWPAPWGPGSPGWHTECSALSLHYLGDVIDVQTGGIDLRFPHHEDERAQSNSVTGHEVVRHWAHGEHLLFDGREMADSAGNVVFLSDLGDRGLDPLGLRLAFLEHRYRERMNLTWDALHAADRTLRRWREQTADWANSPSKPMCAEVTGRIAAAFDDDLDTPAALRALRWLENDPGIPPGSKFETFAYADQLLGLDLARDVGRAPVRRPPPDGA